MPVLLVVLLNTISVSADQVVTQLKSEQEQAILLAKLECNKLIKQTKSLEKQLAAMQADYQPTFEQKLKNFLPFFKRDEIGQKIYNIKTKIAKNKGKIAGLSRKCGNTESPRKWSRVRLGSK